MSSQANISSLDDLNFDNRFIRELPADTETINNRRQVIGACYSRVSPTPVIKPQRVAYSREVAALLDLTPELCESDDFIRVFSGNSLTAGMESYATCYGGHQFGNWAGQLGDGRAINLGEVINKKGERWALQLKGAGPTPYSRTADGLAVLRSSVREFLCSEAMYHLGVPTTRALSLVLTGETVIRDMFYNGNPKAEPGAIVCRVAPSFTRFGNFQILTARGDIALLKKLADYTIRTDFPHLGEPSTTVYIAWFAEVCRRTAEMIVHWQRVGFVHGVMNTDNMSILGLTIDYGPYGWLENFDLNWTPNTTDAEQRRYRFGNQAQIALWNLGQLANAIYPLIEEVEPLQEALAVYKLTFEQGWQSMTAGKLGLNAFDPATDKDLCTELLVLLESVETDMTIFYRQLAKIGTNVEPPLNASACEDAINILSTAYYVPEQITPEYKTRLCLWLNRYIDRLKIDVTPDAIKKQRMNAVNPKYVLRNYLAQLAIDKAEQGDFSMVNELLECLRHPYDEQPGKEEFAGKRPDWARQRAGCSMLSCSS
ncbi:MAG: YdiU family protein [Methylococcales bacterium]|nr:YdiU family protein [Methylococcales bacterium]MDD5632516.1 YdiU family protein [Methylococcales bacterium]